jgi:hypothetical protein
MPIVQNGKVLDRGFFKNEDELQYAIAQNPQILFTEGEPKVFLVKREVILPSAGKLDILLVDELGVPVAVEVKLGRNIQSRREVVAQVFDYAADLNELTVDELDDIVNQSLQSILIDPEKNINNWRVCGGNLRSGNLKIVIAIDESNENLTRIVGYLNVHSDIDVRLVEIHSYDNGAVLVPTILVGGNDEEQNSNQPKINIIQITLLNSVAEAFNQLNLPFKTTGSAKKYKTIRNNWPDPIHYEFLLYAKTISIEFHIENKKFASLSNVIRRFDSVDINGEKIQFEPNWCRGLGRIRLFMSVDTSINDIVSTAKQFIDITFNDINGNIVVQ